MSSAVRGVRSGPHCSGEGGELDPLRIEPESRCVPMDLPASSWQSLMVGQVPARARIEGALSFIRVRNLSRGGKDRAAGSPVRCQRPPALPFHILVQCSDARCSAPLQAHPRTAWSLRRGACAYVTSGIHRYSGTRSLNKRGCMASLAAMLSSEGFRPR
ncbi:hypothetical protein NDU88_004344 [Pleurodeles waltl]|uniref:Uncharacterized protein n=1 Tax=Pleurodeles waltl TaxID=8319 RepID=A0AAV7TTU9_PLEWA|nr:hypothetical protein NDU88_004344 [Pleurodeles waltl]